MPNKKQHKKTAKQKLDEFLASICESKGMGGDLPLSQHDHQRVCRNLDCDSAQWRSHIDIPDGVLCLTYKNHCVSIVRTVWDEKEKEPWVHGIIFFRVEAQWIIGALKIALAMNPGNDH